MSEEEEQGEEGGGSKEAIKPQRKQIKGRGRGMKELTRGAEKYETAEKLSV